MNGDVKNEPEKEVSETTESRSPANYEYISTEPDGHQRKLNHNQNEQHENSIENNHDNITDEKEEIDIKVEVLDEDEDKLEDEDDCGLALMNGDEQENDVDGIEEFKNDDKTVKGIEMEEKENDIGIEQKEKEEEKREENVDDITEIIDEVLGENTKINNENSAELIENGNNNLEELRSSELSLLAYNYNNDSVEENSLPLHTESFETQNLLFQSDLPAVQIYELQTANDEAEATAGENSIAFVNFYNLDCSQYATMQAEQEAVLETSIVEDGDVALIIDGDYFLPEN